MAPEWPRSLTGPDPRIDSAEATTGRLGAVLGAPRHSGLTPLGPHGPWLATDLTHAKRVLMDAADFDFPTTVSRGTDLSAGAAQSRTGHHVYPALSPEQVARGRDVFSSEWEASVVHGAPPASETEIEAMELLRQPVARATCAAVLDHLNTEASNRVADLVLLWLDALAPVISSRRSPRRWSRIARLERSARLDLEASLRAELATRPGEAPAVVANLLAAGTQVPIAAGAWLLVHLAAHPHSDVDPDHAVWEALRVTPPTWATARVATTQVEAAGQLVPVGSLVLVSPLLLGRLAGLAPDAPAGLDAFCPDRWARADVRPGAWLPFGAGAHSCPGRTLGFGMLHDLAIWAARHELRLASSVTIDQSRGIFPSPARIAVCQREGG